MTISFVEGVTYMHAIILGAVQGVTEFLPVSSKGHLLLAQHYMGLNPGALIPFDVILHAGTLFALLALFWREWVMIIRGFFLPRETEGRGLFIRLVAMTLPIVIAGPFLKETFEAIGESEFAVLYTACGFIYVATLMIIAEKTHRHQVIGAFPSWKQLMMMGLLQVVALLPGVSRSGSTIAGGMLAGIPRQMAARWSFLMLTPAIFGATTLIAYDIVKGTGGIPPLGISVTGFVVSAVCSYACAFGMMKFVQRHSLRVFSYYLFALAAFVFGFELLM